jgi:hypothetical protein
MEPSASPSPLLPRLTCPPNPATLHAYIRALGHLAAHDRLLELVQQMATHRGELLERQNLDRSGARMMRRAIVAVRVFLERSSGSFSAGVAYSGGGGKRLMRDAGAGACAAGSSMVQRLQAPADQGLVGRVKEVLDGVGMKEVWGGWPTEEECRIYCKRTPALGKGR